MPTSVTIPALPRRLGAEFLGTFWLVFAGCGAAVIASGVPNVGIGYLGVAFAFGLTVLTMAYAVGHVSGGHFNPAITVGLALGARFAWQDVPAYIVTQVVAAIVAAGVLWVIAVGQATASTRRPPASPPMATATAHPTATRCLPAWSPRWYSRRSSST